MASNFDVNICSECGQGSCNRCLDYWTDAHGDEIYCVCECNKASWRDEDEYEWKEDESFDPYNLDDY